MSTCQFCGAQNLEWLENAHKLVNPITGQEHGIGYCMIKVPRYKVDNGVSYPRKDEYLARDVVDAAIRLKMRPDSKPTRDGDYLILVRR